MKTYKVRWLYHGGLLGTTIVRAREIGDARQLVAALFPHMTTPEWTFEVEALPFD